MFRTAELGHKIEKAIYDETVPQLRESLLESQFELVENKKFPVVILIGGIDGAGKGEIINVLSSWLDPRHVQTHALTDLTDEEKDRPEMWRFWKRLPGKGKTGIFIGGWYRDLLFGWDDIHKKQSYMDNVIEESNEFEKLLASEGALILKFWLHLSKEQQKKRFKALENNPATKWKVGKEDWEKHKNYDKFRNAVEYILRRTSTAEAPWVIVESTDSRYRNLTVGKVILEALRRKLSNVDQPAQQVIQSTPPLLPALDEKSILRSLDMGLAIDKKEYNKLLEKYQGKLNQLTRHPAFRKSGIVLMFEGSDAAGKGGAIRRITASLDARQYQVIPVAAPTQEERAQPWLWRFWRHVPRHGQVTIFDRSWYGRVLVERIEGFCSQDDWMRAYKEINDFENQLSESGLIVVKFWVAISADEQLKRFREREETGFKRYKITDEDWRNRERWDQYEIAVNDMVERTSTNSSPWTLVEGNNKYYARVKILKTLCDRIEQAIENLKK